MLREIRYPAAGFGVAVVVCGGAAWFEEHNFAKRDAECRVSAEPMPSADCNEGPLPHSRTTYVNSLTAASTANTTGIGYFAVVVTDPEHVQPLDLRSPFEVSGSAPFRLLTAGPLSLPPTISSATPMVAYLPDGDPPRPIDWRFVLGPLTPRST